MWDRNVLYRTPQTTPAETYGEANVEAVYLEGPSYRGKPTKIYAYYAVSKVDGDERVPGIVLVHGGGGTAFAEWVRIWSARGYAAIAVDLEGQLPLPKTEQGRPRHDWAGPQRKGEFADYGLPLKEQWMYHAVSAVMLANSFLRSIERVDPSRIGLHGISWGGIVTGIVSGTDDRFAFAVPV
ncbi:acetylxylan esterase [Paenibacillus filicis]|uniref:Acetylxylan esterase n=1 Tax=Paenibacillus gyeongsangnamensis TaxID=3388067 RepID=A0ABT4Q5E4_9BACL|nr:acetylxylan esterase [Paenibacillus filicis]MCZ8512039.1 acetylxylan esterase [Paenibacillus filicis]